MASRRQRIKAVANLPMRRPRGPAPSDSSQLVEKDVTLSASQGEKENILSSERSETESEKQNQNVHDTQEKTVNLKQSGDKDDAAVCSSSSSISSGSGALGSYSILNQEDSSISVGNTQSLLSTSSENVVVTDSASKVPGAFCEDSLRNTVGNSSTSCENAETSDSTSRLADVCYEDTLQGTRTVKTLSKSKEYVVTSVNVPKVSDVSYGDSSHNIRTTETLSTYREIVVTSDSVSRAADISDEGRNIEISGDPKAADTSYDNSLHTAKIAETLSTSNDTGKPRIQVGQLKPGDKSVEAGLLGGGSSDVTDIKAVLDQGNVSVTSSSVARLGRKRFKPAVSLSAAGRRSRDVESNKPVTDVPVSESSVEKSSLTTKNELDSLNSKESSSGKNESESLGKTNSGKSKVDSSVGRNITDIPVDQSDERVPKLGLPTVTGLIPTGTAVHVEQEAGPQAQEADVPVEDASIQPVTPQARTPQTPADARSQCSASDLEEDSRRSFVSSRTITPPFIKKLNREKSNLRLPNLPLKPEALNEERSQNNAKTPDSDVTTVHLDVESAKDVESDTSSVFSQTTVGPIPKIYEKRQRRRLEITQRLLEAKQQFQAKFGNRTPEKSRLTMFDLIFYNPTTNPMRKSEKEKTTQQPTAVPETPAEAEAVEEQLAEESVDDPDANGEDSNQSFAMPVPQVKVGADGQIILDERSLVIETTGAKKNRENLANSVAVLDQGIASYNAYSKNKKTRGKDWSEKETLRFYRALQTVGTDFLLMQTIFPKRSRTELKMKFKREEKANLSLIEKALSHPLPFDLTELQKEAEALENEENKAVEDMTNTTNTTNKIDRNKQKGEKKTKDTRKGAFGRSLDEDDTGVTRNKRKGSELQSNKSDEEEHPISEKAEEKEKEKEKEREKKKRKKKLKKKKTKKKKSNAEDLSGDESDYSSLANGVDAFGGNTSDSGSGNGESDAEMIRLPQVTRSGRISKPRILTDITQEEYNTNWARRERCQDACETVQRREGVNPPFIDIASSLKNLEPGSIVVLTTESPDNPGHQIVNVFMVGPTAPIQMPVGPSPALEMESSSQQSEEVSEAVVTEVDKPG
ncbi:uncharacterized protein Bdp1 [Anabrus simplex]|uniref:uncharacterized protein Bdp1 n=1 Tax=Anabrus simplex TaxID=316456 RepID=UPI0035A2FD17